MFKKLFALCAVTVLLAGCVEYRMPKSEGPMSGGKRTFSVFFDTGSAKLSSASSDTTTSAPSSSAARNPSSNAAGR